MVRNLNFQNIHSIFPLFHHVLINLRNILQIRISIHLEIKIDLFFIQDLWFYAQFPMP